MKTIAIVGFGRFGKTLYRLLKDDFQVVVYNQTPINTRDLERRTVIAKNIREVYQLAHTIFFCVPIGQFAQVIKIHRKYFTAAHLLIDVLSVKMHAQKVFSQYLKNTQTQAILTHPMFGPDSSKQGFAGLTIVMDKFRADEKNFTFWKAFFTRKMLKVVELSAKEHDKIASSSQGSTHFIGRLLESISFRRSKIDTIGAQRLHEVVEQTTNDTWALFNDLQHYNPYTQTMRIRLGDVYDRIYNKLLPKQIKKGILTIGIQGGKGSFNEEAVIYYLKRSGTKKFAVKYLYTSDNVLKAMHRGEIDRGQFAIHNSAGGIVDESIQAMAKFKFRIVEQFAIKIAHALMIRNDTKFSEITTIMTHPQVLAQCKDTLKTKYPQLKKTSGTKELIDHAVVAKYLSQKKLPKHIAVMGSKMLAKIYNLTIIEDCLQDIPENYTSFMQIER